MEYDQLIQEAEEAAAEPLLDPETASDLLGRLADALRECIYGAPVTDPDDDQLPPFPE